MAAQSLHLPAELESALLRGHPWVYRNHIPKNFRAANGDWVQLKCGRFEGYGLWSDEAQIAVRIYSRKQIPDAGWLKRRVADAWRARAELIEGDTDAFRWVFGEADGLPGLVVDRYGSYAVILSYSSSVNRLLPWLVAAINQVAPTRGIVLKDGGELKLLAGKMPPDELEICENGLKFCVEIKQGQKSGFFLDQRDNRATLRRFTQGAKVLNLFAYTGGFSVYAADGGAKQLTSVDLSAGALERAMSNLRLNGLEHVPHETHAVDVFEFLAQAERKKQRYDVVICDPPSFAKSKDQLRQALRAYERVNRLALKLVKPYGIYATASCTSQVGPEAFRQVLAEAASHTPYRLQIIHEAGQGLDHPVLAQHLEGRYLKYLVARALPLD